MRNYIFLVVVIAIYGVNAYAGGPLTGKKINSVGFNTTGFFIYSSGWSNPNSCTRTDAVVLLESDSNYDKAYALLLAAYMAGKEVSGYSDGCTTSDSKTYNTIRGYKYLKVE